MHWAIPKMRVGFHEQDQNETTLLPEYLHASGARSRRSFEAVLSGSSDVRRKKTSDHPGWPDTCTQSSARMPETEIIPSVQSRRPLPLGGARRRKPVHSTPAARAKRDGLVLAHLSWAKTIAIGVHETLPPWVELDDVFHAAVLGLFEAATRFHDGRSVAFAAYARHRIRGAILDSLRQADWLPRRVRRWHKQAANAVQSLSNVLQRPPSEAEIENELGPKFRKSRLSLGDLQRLEPICFSSTAGTADDPPHLDVVPSKELLPEAACARKQIGKLVLRAVDTLPERQRRVVVLYYTEDMTMKNIGTLLGVHESRVSQLHKSALKRMAQVLEQSGVRPSDAV
jgi:RNA polymerase sigma factor for flagellar operon FliA